MKAEQCLINYELSVNITIVVKNVIITCVIYTIMVKIYEACELVV